MALIILPQALKLVIPGIVGTFIGLFKDTSLVLIIGLFDLLGIVQLNSADPEVVLAHHGHDRLRVCRLRLLVFCFGMSRYSQMIERRLAVGDRR